MAIERMIAVKGSIVSAALGKLWDDSEGSVLLEATIVVPVLVALFLGVFEFSWYFYNQQLVEIGIRDAARYMARVPITDSSDPSPPCGQVDTKPPDPVGTNFAFTANAANIAVTGQIDSGGAPRVRGWTASDVTVSCLQSPTGAYADGATTMTIIYVTTTFPDPAFGFFPVLGLTAPSLKFTHQERYIGPG